MTFITVRYGENEELLVNSNCLASVLLQYIKQKCGYNFPESIDLATENGEVIELAAKSKEYAKKYVDIRSSYILLKVVGDENEETPMYVPLLENVSDKLKLTFANRRSQRKQGPIAINNQNTTSSATGNPITGTNDSDAATTKKAGNSAKSDDKTRNENKENNNKKIKGGKK